ncbi:hypothetical protein Ahy_A02g004930 [Arachis hypogaea]|uniref:MATH domain-containing protein n=1 Tax=Arachis hypogaea TaxID=3818 RepID=A0A445E5G9_ARAHY|nr:hypothetical protein Ahy_A02g004930 [Arachis hypogaea]
MFPKGNKVDYLSIYLDASDAATLPNGWTRFSKFQLVLINQFFHYGMGTEVLQNPCMLQKINETHTPSLQSRGKDILKIKQKIGLAY